MSALFFRSYLLAYVYWIEIPLGTLALTLVHRLTGGRWGDLLQPFLKASNRTLIWMALTFLPLLIGIKALYPWADAERVRASAELLHKSVYLNAPFFALRAVVYFGVWIGIARLLVSSLRFRNFPGLALVVFTLTGTFAAIDWIMSLEPAWASSMFGVWYLVGSLLAALSLTLLALLWNRGASPPDEPLRDVFHDHGNLLLVFVSVWAYSAFMQFLIIWSGNLPEESFWYIERSQNGWGSFAAVFALFGFAVPFALLLARRIKRRLHWLASIAALILLVRGIELYWTIDPIFYASARRWPLMEVLVWVGMGGAWLIVYRRALARELSA